MRRVFSIFAILFFSFSIAFGQFGKLGKLGGDNLRKLAKKKIVINKQPSNIDEFRQMRDSLAKSAEGGAAMFLLALKIYTENQDLGRKCLVLTVTRSHLSTGNDYKGYSVSHADMVWIDNQLGKDNSIPRAYIKGASPDNNYQVSLPYVYKFYTNKYSGNRSSGVIKLFVQCYGADSDRPITMVKNNRGLWKADNWSSIIIGVKHPAPDDDL